jgi:thiosulfate/3-mercaptopyruvate sulfurtransferase
MYTTLITAHELLATPQALVFDCSFELMKPAEGDAQYLEQHIAGAVRADLDRHLSAKPPRPAVNGGRHPLPTRDDVAQWLAQSGLQAGQQVVVYDRQGANYCGRLWWMLKWLGHEAVAVLDGGLQAWQAAGGAVVSGQEPARAPGHFVASAPLGPLRTVSEVQQQLGQGQTIVDARATPRYKGEVEPLDPVAGHIPGALNRPFNLNLQADGTFKPAAQLREEFLALLGDRDPASVVHQCGSGVSAVPNLLAMEIAGLGRTALYAGSWSEWCADPTRPVEKG